VNSDNIILKFIINIIWYIGKKLKTKGALKTQCFFDFFEKSLKQNTLTIIS